MLCKLSVVIVHYKVPQLIVRCLDSLYLSAKNFDIEVFVVDNSPTEQLKATLLKRYNNIIYIPTESNLGFARANNIAICKATGDMVLLLNPDVILTAQTIESLFSSISCLPDFGAVGVKMVNGRGEFLPESKRNLPSLKSSFYKLIGKKNSGYYLDSLDKDRAGECPVLSGAFMLLNYNKIGSTALLDEDFFMYGEDIDLSYRILKAGYKNYYLPIVVTHLKGKSTNKTSRKWRKNFYGAMRIYYKKHGKSKLGYWGVCVFSYILQLIAAIK